MNNQLFSHPITEDMIADLEASGYVVQQEEIPVTYQFEKPKLPDGSTDYTAADLETKEVSYTVPPSARTPSEDALGQIEQDAVEDLLQNSKYAVVAENIHLNYGSDKLEATHGEVVGTYGRFENGHFVRQFDYLIQ
jgi:hypothetical protein